MKIAAQPFGVSGKSTGPSDDGLCELTGRLDLGVDWDGVASSAAVAKFGEYRHWLYPTSREIEKPGTEATAAQRNAQVQIPSLI